MVLLLTRFLDDLQQRPITQEICAGSYWKGMNNALNWHRYVIAWQLRISETKSSFRQKGYSCHQRGFDCRNCLSGYEPKLALYLF